MSREKSAITIGCLPREAGLTLVELLVVLVIVALLAGTSLASYLGFRERAQEAAAHTNVRTIVPAIHAYHVDHGTYATMTLAALKADYDQSLDTTLYSFGSAGNLTDDDYCVQSTSGAETYRKAGPNADIVPGTCP